MDKESGIKSTQMRFKKWFTYSPWVEVINPVVYPKDVWSVELKVVNNKGLEDIKSLSFYKLFYQKIIILFLTLIVILFISYRVFNQRNIRL